MSEVYSLPASTSLLTEVNKVGRPDRRKDQDGTIGDRTHMGHVSDHNLDEIGNTGTSSDADDIPEVHARDIDARGPWLADWSMERIVQIIVARCRSGAEKRLKYIIFNRRIWSASSGWAQKPYDGADPHDLHAHFSFRYGSGAGASNPENITAPWGILAAFEEEAMLTAAEIATEVVKQLSAHQVADAADTKTPKRTLSNDTWISYTDVRWKAVRADIARLQATMDGVLKNVVADDGEAAQIVADIDRRAGELEAEIGAVPSAVLGALADAGRSEQDVADALRAVLGDRAEEVGKLLAGTQ